jgi:hypothetical protein
MTKKPLFGELNSTEHSQEPENLDPKNLTGIDLIRKNNSDATKPKIIKKILGPFKGIVFRGGKDEPFRLERKDDGSIFGSIFNFLSKGLTKHRIYIPELHSHLPDIGEDYANVPIEIASLFPFFIAQDTSLEPVEPGTLVWCDFLDRVNFKDPVYLGPVDPKTAQPAGASGGFINNALSLFGIAGNGDAVGGVSYKNTTGQVSYPSVPAGSTWTGELPINGFTATTATIDDLINIARQQVGKREQPEGTDGGPQIDPFNGGRREAWCNAGLAWCFRQIGAPLPGDKLPSPGPDGFNKVHSVFFTEQYFENLGALFKEPQRGDMVVYIMDGNTTEPKKAKKHIALVTEVDGDKMRTIEFNWGVVVGVTYQDWKRNVFLKPDGTVSKSTKMIVHCFLRRPLPYSGVPSGIAVSSPVASNVSAQKLARFSGITNIVANGIDYSFSRPTPQEILAAGNKFVMRYVPYGTGKDLTKPEMDSLLNAGLQVGFVFQRYGDEFLAREKEVSQLRISLGDSKTAGKKIAEKSLKGMRGLGFENSNMPVVYYAIEADRGTRAVEPQEFDALRRYFDGIKEYYNENGIPIQRIGMYGGGPSMQMLAQESSTRGCPSYFWQAGGWTPTDYTTKKKPAYTFTNLIQYQIGELAGKSVDFNVQVKTDAGLIQK